MSNRYILAIDVGTTGCKAAIFDIEGHAIVDAYREYNFSSPTPDQAEQDTALWWNSTQDVIKETMAKSHISPGDVSSVGISGQGPVMVPIDKYGRSLRPAMLWMDQRAAKQSTMIEKETGKKVGPITQILPEILWLRENEPNIYRNTYKFLDKTVDYVAYLLTGNINCAILTPYSELLESIEVLKLDPGKFPELKRSDQIVGYVTDQAEERTGLRRGTPVVSGGGDGILCIYGTGVTDPGEASAVVGTSTCLDVCLKRKIVDPQGRVWSLYNLILEKWVMAGCTSTSGASYRWFRDVFCESEVERAKQMGVRPYELLDREAGKVKPGCDGLFFLPYLKGERSPIWDSNARGVFFGIKPNHGKSHFVRAILEGTAFSFYDIMQAMEETGVKIKEIRMCGGGARSPLWRQIKADVTGKPILLPEVIDASLLGAAILAARTVGIYRDIEEAVRSMVRIVERNEPDESRHYYYSELYEIYRELYLNLKDTYKRAALLPQERA